MKKLILIAGILLMIFLATCSQNKPVACTEDAKICPDGSAVVRIGPKCEFAECPVTPSDESKCNYNDTTKRYVAKKTEQCAVIKYVCKQDEGYFSDECGCGCMLKSAGNENSTGKDDVSHHCKPEQRNAQVCTQIYQPVCGWFDPARIQCVKYPCAQDYSSPCGACSNPDVISWTDGKCPK